MVAVEEEVIRGIELLLDTTNESLIFIKSELMMMQAMLHTHADMIASLQLAVHKPTEEDSIYVPIAEED